MFKILPTPKQLDVCTEKIAILKQHIIAKDTRWQDLVEITKEAIFYGTDADFTVCNGGIELIYDASVKSGEYKISFDGIMKAYASDYEGMRYACASIIQIICTNKGFEMPYFNLYDYSDTQFRAVMIDLARQWHPFRQLLTYVKLCFLYKTKYIHFHFSDTQSYTLESKAFPKLAKENRKYTIEQIEILKNYAKKHGIEIIPEFECPGHARILTTEYPDFFANKYDSDIGEKCQIESGIFIDTDEVICVGSEKAINAVYTIIDETISLFPDSKYIHIGGEEVPTELWNKCEHCRKYMKEKGYTNVSELYCDFIGRVASYVVSKGKTPIVWEGFPKKYSYMIPKETVVIAWETCYNYPNDLLDDGFKIINASWKPLYIVPLYFNEFEISREKALFNTYDILDWNIYNWKNWSPGSVSTLNPITISPTDQLIGSMMCVWELTFEQAINRVMENLITLSERIWNTQKVLTDDEFITNQGAIVPKIARIIQER